jgi:hypothetical protein
VLDDEEAVQQFECHGWHREEVERRDHLALVLEKGQPAFAMVAPATNSPKIPGHTSFRDDEAELLQFSVDLGGSPVLVSRSESEYRRYQRTRQTVSSGAVCRHLKIVGRIAFFTISSGYQPRTAKVATHPFCSLAH